MCIVMLGVRSVLKECVVCATPPDPKDPAKVVLWCDYLVIFLCCFSFLAARQLYSLCAFNARRAVRSFIHPKLELKREAPMDQRERERHF